MVTIARFKNFSIYPLTKKLAEQYASAIILALDQIPLVDKHTVEDLFAETKGERVFHQKWEHSFIAVDDHQQFAAVLISYEREAEGNEQYPRDCLYVSDFAVATPYQKQGLGKEMIRVWLETNRQKGFLDLKNLLRFAIQTNEADFNRHVQKMYESFGFQKIATKSYGNRVDNVYILES